MICGLIVGKVRDKGDWIMDMRKLQYVLMLAHYGNITKAAEALYIAQPTLSIFLNNLEQELGVRLFDRVGRKLVMTYAGEQYVETARQIMMMKYELDDKLNDIKNDHQGRIRLGLALKRVPYLMPRVISRFHQIHPDIRILLEEEHLSDVEAKLLTADLDLMLCNHTISNPRLEYETIYQDQILAALPAGHPAAERAVDLEGQEYPWLDLKYVKDEIFILQHTSQSIRQFAEDALLYAGVLPQQTFKISSIEAGVQLAAEGYGVAFNMKSYVSQYHYAKPVRHFLVGDPELKIEFAAAYRKGTYIRGFLHEFIEVIRECV